MFMKVSCKELEIPEQQMIAIDLILYIYPFKILNIYKLDVSFGFFCFCFCGIEKRKRFLIIGINC